MTISVASYMQGIPAKNTKPEKPAILTGIIEGVLRYGDAGTVVHDSNIIDADVAVIQGFVHGTSKNAPHLNLRRHVIEHQHQQGKRTLLADSNLFLYAMPENKAGLLRYSYDGVFPNTGEYCNDNPDPRRWEKISKNLNISLKPWKRNGSTILICCQRATGWSMNGTEFMPWLFKTIKKIKARSQRTIVVRFHPGDSASKYHIKALLAKNIPNVRVSTAKDIREDFRHAHVVVSYNSSPGVVAAIEGIPVVVLDPEHSQAKDVSTHHLNSLDNPPVYDRGKWILQMAQMHWTIDELKSGEAWRHLRKYAIR